MRYAKISGFLSDSETDESSGSNGVGVWSPGQKAWSSKAGGRGRRGWKQEGGPIPTHSPEIGSKPFFTGLTRWIYVGRGYRKKINSGEKVFDLCNINSAQEGYDKT